MDAPSESRDLDESAARRMFWLVALSFATLTALLPPLCFPTFRGDVLEQIVIGREWVLGSAKHPALTTWIMQIFWVGLGGSRFAPSLAASVCATVTMWAVWRLGRDYVTEREALVGSLCLTAYWYTSLGGATMFNNNVTMIAFWHLTILGFHQALKTGRNTCWMLTGLLLGASLLCKYTAVILAISMGIFMLANPDARRRLRTAGPWLAAMTTALVFLPHAVFMAVEFGGSYEYFERKRMGIGFLPFCLVLGRDVLLQLLIAAPILLIVAPLVGRRPQPARRGVAGDYTATFLPALFVLPIAIQTLLQLVMRVPYIQRSYGAHMWILLGLCSVYLFRVTTDPRRWRMAAIGTAGLAAALLASLPVATATTYHFARTPSVHFYPGRALAERVDAVWDGAYSEPCRYLAGRCGDHHPCWAAGAYSRHQPHVIDPELGRWVRDEHLNAEGGVVVWTWGASEPHDGMPQDIRDRFPDADFRGTVELPYLLRRSDAATIQCGVAVVAPPRTPRMATAEATSRR